MERQLTTVSTFLALLLLYRTVQWTYIQLTIIHHFRRHVKKGKKWTRHGKVHIECYERPTPSLLTNHNCYAVKISLDRPVMHLNSKRRYKSQCGNVPEDLRLFPSQVMCNAFPTNSSSMYGSHWTGNSCIIPIPLYTPVT